jgi:hypothetical protein
MLAGGNTCTADVRTASARALHDHIVARTCRLADAMLRMSSRHIRKRWNLRNTDLRLLNILDAEAPLPVSEISRRALLDQAWVSRSLRALEASRLVIDSSLFLKAVEESGGFEADAQASGGMT